jgi:hypothetical protein
VERQVIGGPVFRGVVAPVAAQVPAEIPFAGFVSVHKRGERARCRDRLPQGQNGAGASRGGYLLENCVERVDPVFYSDPMTAAMKAPGMT